MKDNKTDKRSAEGLLFVFIVTVLALLILLPNSDSMDSVDPTDDQTTEVTATEGHSLKDPEYKKASEK